MKAAYIDEFGGPDVLKFGDLPDPKAAAGEVIVDVHAASVNAADWKFRAGEYSRHANVQFPQIPGRDFSGVVSAMGSGADLKVGDPVFGVLAAGKEGTYCEKIAIGAALIAKKPDNVSDYDFRKQKQQPTILFNYTAANAAMNAKEYAAAVASFKAVLALDPDDLSTNYNLGRAYLAMTPPQQMDAFWYFAKSVTSKKATQAQADKVKKYLKGLIANYQGGNVCDSLTDGELNELLQLAGSSADRPSTYSLRSAAEIGAAQKDMTIASVFADLKAAGDKSKLTWLAACGLEFPEVPGKVIEVRPGDPLVLKIAFVTSDAEFDAATTPNMDVKVVGQPEAARVEKNSAVHFTGTLVSYDPDPFFLHWDKAKVKAEDIPKEKGQKKPPVRRPTTRKPSGLSN